LALSQTLRKKNLKSILHLSGGFVGEGHRQDLGGIGTMLTNEVSNAMGECSRLATACTCHHQQGTLVMINRPALSVVKAC
jgi:hypothetical protein